MHPAISDSVCHVIEYGQSRWMVLLAPMDVCWHDDVHYKYPSHIPYSCILVHCAQCPCQGGKRVSLGHF